MGPQLSPPKRSIPLGAIVAVAAVISFAATTLAIVAPLGTINIGPDVEFHALGMHAKRSQDGVYWILTVVTIQDGEPYSATTLRIVRPDGTTNLTATAWSSLGTAANGCSLEKANTSATVVSLEAIGSCA